MLILRVAQMYVCTVLILRVAQMYVCMVLILRVAQMYVCMVLILRVAQAPSPSPTMPGMYPPTPVPGTCLPLPQWLIIPLSAGQPPWPSCPPAAGAGGGAA